MGAIFEVFGFPVGDDQPEAEEVRRSAWCPFMAQECDGGGNRHLSNVDLKVDPELRDFFDGLDEVPAGICSLRPTPASEPWIVCPRRLLASIRRFHPAR
jgi:hypothetical protein